MKPLGIFIAVFFSCISIVVDAQEYEYIIVDHGTAEMGNYNFNVDPDDIGSVSGRVTSSDGRAIAGANIVLYDGLNFYCVKSKKDGAYKIGGHFGMHVIEVSVPGYRKYSGEADVPKGREIEMNIVLEPAFDSVADIRSAGNGMSCHGNVMNFAVNAKHPAYKDKTLLDVLRDVPMITVDDGKFAVAGMESADFYVNGNPFKAPYATALKFFGNIDAAKMKSVRVMILGPKAPVSISYNE